MNLSFAGCGFMSVYHIGVASCFRTYAPHILVNKISGASSGACVALTLLVGSPLEDLASHYVEGCYRATKGKLGPFSFDPHAWLREGLEKGLPEDAHLQANGRFHASVTRVFDWQNILVSQFDTREDLVQAVLASCFVPIYTGLLPPKHKGSRVTDGAYSNNLPILDHDTITVSPFSGCADICPQTNDFKNGLLVNWLPNSQPNQNSIDLSNENMIRIFHIIFPPSPELAARYYKQGFEDTLRFLQSRYLISCTRCVGMTADPDCGECDQQRQEANAGNVPCSVAEVFVKYVEIDQSYSHIIQDHQILKMIYYISMIVANGLMWNLTLIFPKIFNFIEKLVDQLLFLVRVNQSSTSPSLRTQNLCELQISQSGEDSRAKLVRFSDHDQEKNESVNDILNFGLVAHQDITSSKLLGSPELVKEFQIENPIVAVVSHSGLPSIVGSAKPTQKGSSTVSRMGRHVISQDQLDYSLDASSLRSSLETSIPQHPSSSSSKVSIVPYTAARPVMNIEQGLKNPLVSVYTSSKKGYNGED